MPYGNTKNLYFPILGIFYLERCGVDVKAVGTFRGRGRGGSRLAHRITHAEARRAHVTARVI